MSADVSDDWSFENARQGVECLAVELVDAAGDRGGGMIAAAGLTKVIAVGGGLVSGVALLAGAAGGGRYAAAQADPTGLASAACGYAGRSPETRGSGIGSELVGSARELGLTVEQVTNARHIIEAARDLRLPVRAAVIGVATALQESALKSDAAGGNGRTLGILQQHPEHGWGTRAQIANPRHATRSFFARLIKVKEWEGKPLTVAAQAVQRSAFPNAYARHERRAESIVRALTSSKRSRGPDHVELSAEDLAVVRSSLEGAIVLGIPRAAVVADIAAGLHAGKLPSARRPSSEDDAQLAEQVVTSVADRLCTDLSRKISNVLDPATLTAAATSGRGAIALRSALGMIGVPYSWGGGGPQGPTFGIGRGVGTRGFDCSGLAEYAWAKAGIKIGGHTSTQWQAGTRISRSQLRPGDLIFFATNPQDPATIYHVVLNIDGTRYVHAPYTGSKVQVTRWTPRQEPHYAGAIRPG
jgi:cell wall-associated NlpC family hydrolase